MSIIPSVGWFVAGQEDADVVNEFTLDLLMNVQLSFYLRQDMEKWGWEFVESKDFIHTIHLCKGIRESDFFKGNIVSELAALYDVKRFVIHPFSDDVIHMVDRARELGITLCLETFQRHQANPFTMLAMYGEELEADHLGMCVDFSHLTDKLANEEFIKGLLPYTKLWHVSNRVGKNQHLPVFTNELGIHPQGILSRLLDIPKFPVQEIVLEYMKEYKAQLIKHYLWLATQITKKRKRFSKEST